MICQKPQKHERLLRGIQRGAVLPSTEQLRDNLLNALLNIASAFMLVACALKTHAAVSFVKLVKGKTQT